MAKCPRCGYRLGLFDISQNCPECKVNMRFFNFEENFHKEAKEAELSKARALVKVRRFKAAYIGSKAAIARLCVMLLPLAAFVLPAGAYILPLPGRDFAISLDAISLYGLYDENALDIFLSMCQSEALGGEFIAIRNVLICYIAAAFCAFMIFMLTVLCFWSYKNMQKILSVVSGLGIAATIVAVILNAGIVLPHFTVESGFGFYVIILTFAVNLGVNVFLSVKGIPVEYEEGMLERVEIYKKIKSGEVSFDSLPQPIVETEKTRAIKKEIEKEMLALEQQKNGLSEVAET